METPLLSSKHSRLFLQASRVRNRKSNSAAFSALRFFKRRPPNPTQNPVCIVWIAFSPSCRNAIVTLADIFAHACWVYKLSFCSDSTCGTNGVKKSSDGPSAPQSRFLNNTEHSAAPNTSPVPFAGKSRGKLLRPRSQLWSFFFIPALFRNTKMRNAARVTSKMKEEPRRRKEM